MSSRFPDLPVLNLIESSFQGNTFEGIGVVGFQHLLLTTGSLLESLVRLGVDPQNVFISGKWYSTNDKVKNDLSNLGFQVRDTPSLLRPGHFGESCRDTAKSLWQDALEHFTKVKIKRILVLDDGGYCFSQIPPAALSKFFVVGVEQTTSGLKWAANTKIPSVAVAKASIKKRIESHLVAKVVVGAVPPALTNESTPIGVVGLGSIGSAVRSLLLSEGLRVLVYDPMSELRWKLPWSVPQSLSNIVLQCPLIFGCSGSDVSSHLSAHMFSRQSETYLASASSGDIEFNHLIRNSFSSPIDMTTHSDLLINTKNGCLHILNAGCPVNFKQMPESVPGGDIQLTRALLLAGAYQAVTEQATHTGLSPISADYERLILSSWLRTESGRAFHLRHPQPVAECYFDIFGDITNNNIAA